MEAKSPCEKDSTGHCKMHHILSEEESERVRQIFQQQGIALPEKAAIGHIAERGGPADCPFHASLGKETQYCVDTCFLQHLINDQAEEQSK